MSTTVQMIAIKETISVRVTTGQAAVLGPALI